MLDFYADRDGEDIETKKNIIELVTKPPYNFLEQNIKKHEGGWAPRKKSKTCTGLVITLYDKNNPGIR